MSSTRYAPDGSPLAQHRYASAREYAEVRPINGTAVVAKASLLDPAEARLLYTIQGLTLQPGGPPALAAAILEMFPDLATGPSQWDLQRDHLKRQAESLRRLQSYDNGADDKARPGVGFKHKDASPRNIDGVRRAQEQLARALVEICIDPGINIPARGETTGQRICDFRVSDIVNAVHDFHERRRESQMQQLADIEPTRRMLAAVSKTDRSPKLQIIEGLQGTGKTKVFDAVCQANPGAFRMVKLETPLSKTVFFDKVTDACGLGKRKATEAQLIAGDFLRSSRIVLVLDEAHAMLSASARTNTQPELLDWCYQALTNHGVPVILSTTSAFSDRISHITKRIPWNFSQIDSRADRTVLEKPTVDDVEAVGWKLFPDADKRAMRALAIYLAKDETPLRKLFYWHQDFEQDYPGARLTLQLLQETITGGKSSSPAGEPQRDRGRAAMQPQERIKFDPKLVNVE